jgi:hypothetical protein
MSQALSKFEAQLQRLIEEGTARLFSAQDLKKQLAASLVETMHGEVQFGDADNLVAPGVYTIYASSEHAGALKSNESLLDDLSLALKSAATASSVTLTCEPVLHISPSDDLGPGEFRVRSSGLGDALSQTQSLRTPTALAQPQAPAGAFLIVGGAQIFPLTLAIINIGRKKDNDLVLDNPAISRRHAQLRVIAGHYHFFDLGSTGGSKVNNTEVKTAALLAGDVITLAGVPLIFGQDSPPSLSQTQEFKPGHNGSQRES